MDETDRLQAARRSAPLRFDMLLSEAGIALKDVLLIRHQDTRVGKGRSLYRQWRDDPVAFDAYQSRQGHNARKSFGRPYWASFVADPQGGTLFVGLYEAGAPAPNPSEWIAPLSGKVLPPGSHNIYPLTRAEALGRLAGLLIIDWGPGTRMWTQLAENRDKPILEVRRALKEPDFPGYAAFMAQLSEMESLPASWASALGASRGVYLLACPRTNEQYVGAAVGAGGFLSR